MRLISGADPSDAERRLREAAGSLENASTAHDKRDKYDQYCRWANDTVVQLRHCLSAEDLELMVLTRRYWAIQDQVTAQDTSAVTRLLNMEVEERVRSLEQAAADLKEQIKHWAQAGRLVIPDTSMFIRHPTKFAEWDLRSDLGTAELDIRLLVPIVVVDELDGLKESRDRNTRWRAGHSLGLLSEKLRHDGTAVLVAGDKLARSGEVSVEVVLDPPRHVRLPINDDEIIDRGLSVQTVARRPVTLLTYDTGQELRARQANIGVQKFSLPAEAEPS